jgi:protein-disulfide isomerase
MSLRPPVSGRDHSQGPPDASVTLVEYGDYECPFCAQAHPIVKLLQRRLGNSMRFVFRHFPLTTIHPRALHAAESAESAAAHAGEKAFWCMHNAIYERPQHSPLALEDESLVIYATECGANPQQVAADLGTNAFEERVREDFTSGVRSGVNGTPTFFVNGERYDLPWDDAATFEAALREAASSVGAR